MGAIAIVDYGVGNLLSVQKAFESLGFEAFITSEPDLMERSSGIILPGVGAFPDAMRSIKNMKIDKAILKAATDQKPIMGICLGMQLLFDTGYEVERCDGLGLISGNIRKLQGDIKIPHMGWNDLTINTKSPILKGVEEGSYVYFVHSYFAEMEDEANVNASTFYGSYVPAVVSKGNIFGIQFHPEKSGKIGVQILKNFGELIA